MYFYNLIKDFSKEKKTIIYFDMDGVISSYDFGKPLNFKIKRPLTNNINVIKKVSNLDNVELHILSVCRTHDEINDKNNWLDKYAPFFKKENRHILARYDVEGSTAKELKLNFLNSLKTTSQIIVVDDDNEILKSLKENTKDIILLQDSELID